jgi:N-methylhydantoinase B
LFRKSGHPISEGDILRCYACGGGGYGDPLERDPRLVREDVMEGLVSVQRAREVYGVVINPKTYEVDDKETHKLREKERKNI